MVENNINHKNVFIKLIKNLIINKNLLILFSSFLISKKKLIYNTKLKLDFKIIVIISNILIFIKKKFNF